MLLAMAVPASAGTEGAGGGILRTCLGLYDTREQFNPGSGEVETVTAYWIPLVYPDGTEEDFPVQGLGACVTTVKRGGGTLPVASDSLSILAYNNQCRYLETEGIVPGYPYNFYGNPAYRAYNRADCIYFLRAFHTGVLPPGPPA